MKKYIKKQAFALAEVLITLGIIGIVAALTIPNLMQNTNDKELVSSYLKIHNVLNNAYKEAESLTGFKINALSPEEFKTAFEDHLKLLGKRGCAHDVCLADGSFFDYECDENQCSSITVDTNGTKRPNSPGKDIYVFKITEKGLISEGEQDICSGYDCGNYVLSQHKLFTGLLDGCATYGDNGRCSGCADGYKLNNGLCSALNTPNCNAYSGESCSSCDDGYRNNDGSCEKLNYSNCLEYSGDKCSSCDTGYDGDDCSGCASGYYSKSSGTCETQPTYCATMENDGANCTLHDGTVAYKVGDEYVAHVNQGAFSPYGTFAVSNGTRPDYWAGAVKACQDKNMRLPTKDELLELYAKKGQPGIPTSGWYWSSTDDGGTGAFDISFDNGAVAHDYKNDTVENLLCVADAN